jgi:hypothetical protein
MWNGQRASVVNQMPANAQEESDHHSMQTTQYTSLASATKDKKSFKTKWRDF